MRSDDPNAPKFPEPEAELPDGSPPTEAEVLAILAPVAKRIADVLERPGAGRAAIVDVLRSSQGAVELLAAAFDSGRADVAREGILRAGGALPAAPVAPDWSDIEADGEKRAVAAETSICGACVHRAVCRARPPAEMLVVVSRCIAFRNDEG